MYQSALILNWGKSPILDYIGGALSDSGCKVRYEERHKHRATDIIDSISTNPPSVMITRQRLYHGLSKVAHHLNSSGIQTFYADLGVWPHYKSFLLDCSGENATSSVVGDLHRLQNDFSLSKRIENYLPRVAQMQHSLQSEAKSARPPKNEESATIERHGYNLLILQREGDQVLVHDSCREWSDPCNVATAAIYEAEKRKEFLIIKPHPMSKRVSMIPKKGPFHAVIGGERCNRQNDAILAKLILNASRVIMVNSTVHFKSVALGIPTACLGRGWFSGNAVVVEAKNMQDAFDTNQAKDASFYLAYMLSKQMPIEDFQDSQKVMSLMNWVAECHGMDR